MPDDPQDLSDLFDKHDAKLKEQWGAEFAAFKEAYQQQKDAEKTILNAWEKRVDEAVGGMNTGVEKSGRVLENHKFTYQTMITVTAFVISLLSFAGAAGTFFGTEQYNKLAQLADKIGKQSDDLRKQQTDLKLAFDEIDSAKKQEVHNRIETVLDRTFADLDSTMGLISLYEPGQEFFEHLRSLSSDSESIARAKDDLQELRIQEADAAKLNTPDATTTDASSVSDRRLKARKDLADRLDLDEQALDLIADALPIVYTTTNLTKDDNISSALLDHLSLEWTRLYNRIKQFPVKRDQLTHLAGCCQDSLGSLESRRAIKSQSEEGLKSAAGYYAKALAEYPLLARAAANEANMRLKAYQLHAIKLGSWDVVTAEDASQAIKELDEIVKLYNHAMDLTSSEWLTTLIKGNLAVAFMERASVRWYKKSTTSPIRMTYAEDVKEAYKTATEARLSPHGLPDFCVSCGDILCAQLMFEESADQKIAYQRALAKWNDIATLLHEAKMRGWDAPSTLADFLSSYPHFQYIYDLGGDLKTSLEKLISKQ